MKFDLEYLQHSLAPLAQQHSLLVGLSGGMDSVVLLYGMCRVAEESLSLGAIRAIHVNHGLQAEADQWQIFCESLCNDLGVPLHCEKVEIKSHNSPDLSIENIARKARYGVFESQLKDGEVLILGHHLDDQLETLLFRLNRGAGLKGLTAIPKKRDLAKGEIYRPLLEVGRKELQRFAEAHNLQWIKDQSNQDTSFDRNFLRNEILPIIESRWPNYRSSWGKSLQLIREANEMLRELADSDLSSLLTKDKSVISIIELGELSEARQRNVFRFWIEKSGLPDPGWNLLQRMVCEFATLDKQGEAVIAASGFSLRRYRDSLYLLKEQANPPESLNWIPQEKPEIEIEGCGTLAAREVIGGGLAKSQADSFDSRFRKGGESCRLLGRPSKSLKKLLQEANIEPWWRERIPLIYRNNELVCIPGIGVAETSAAAPNEPGIEFQWWR